MKQTPHPGAVIRIGDRVTVFHGGSKHTIAVTDTRLSLGSVSIPGGEIIGHQYGQVSLAGVEMIILPATAVDHMGAIQRGPQIILPDDAALIMLHGSVTPGTTVLEAGSGSGSLTMALASAVGPDGHVLSLDLRRTNSELAARNIARAGLSNRVTFGVGDVRDRGAVEAMMRGPGRSERAELDTVILDIPDPWEALDTVHGFLKIGGTLVCYLPTMNQVETLRCDLEDWDGGVPRFIEIRSRETLVRELAVKRGAVRPAYSMLGHTAYLTFARRYR